MVLSNELIISVAARSSALSRTQVEEVFSEISLFYPHITFDATYVLSTGDKDLKTSLKLMDKTDFFTKEIDEMLLKGDCRIAIHSAKDLPDPLPKGLEIVALTKGVDPSDSLLFREGGNLASLPSGAKIATSSLRREEMIKNLRDDLICVDIRGTIEERIRQLDAYDVDALVIAEAALIRLGLTEKKRMKLPGPYAKWQGKLAVIARDDDHLMKEMFSKIDVKNSIHEAL